MTDKRGEKRTDNQGIYEWWSTNERIGCGWRLVIAFDRKRKYISLLSCGDLTLVRITTQEWDDAIKRGAAHTNDTINLKRLTRQLDRHRRWLNRLAVPCPNAAVKRVIAEISHQAE